MSSSHSSAKCLNALLELLGDGSLRLHHGRQLRVVGLIVQWRRLRRLCLLFHHHRVASVWTRPSDGIFCNGTAAWRLDTNQAIVDGKGHPNRNVADKAQGRGKGGPVLVHVPLPSWRPLLGNGIGPTTPPPPMLDTLLPPAIAPRQLRTIGMESTATLDATMSAMCERHAQLQTQALSEQPCL